MDQLEQRLNQEIEEYSMSRRLSVNLLIENRLGSIEDTELSYQLHQDRWRITEAITSLDSEVWFGAGLQRYIQEATKRGHSLQSGNIEALLFATAGRAMITLTDKETGSAITVITGEDDTEPRMGLQSINGTAEDGVHLLQYLIDLAKKGEMRFTPDEKVWFG